MPSIINSDDGVVSGTSGLKTTGGNDGILNFQSNGSTIAAVTTSAFQVNGNSISAANGVNYRNRIFNGDMRIAQRTTTALTVNSGADFFAVDRFHGSGTASAGVFTVQQSSTVPSNAGLVNSFIVTVTTADASLTGTDSYAVRYIIEGYDSADFEWGTANAKSVTLSFWVRSSVTGTFSGALANADATRSYAFTYTISAANTWEQKSVTIVGNTSGTWNTTNGRGVQVLFSMGGGPDRLIAAGSWTTTTSTAIGATGSVNLISTLNATWYVTGVQLEVGSVATPFERRPYGTELALCQRYCRAYSSYPLGRTRDGDTMQGGGPVFGITMRATPTLRSGASFTVSSGANGTPQIYSGVGYASSPDTVLLNNLNASWSSGVMCAFTGTFEAEL